MRFIIKNQTKQMQKLTKKLKMLGEAYRKSKRMLEPHQERRKILSTGTSKLSRKFHYSFYGIKTYPV